MLSSAMCTSTLQRRVLFFIFVGMIVNQVLAVGDQPSHSRIRRTVQEKKHHRALHHSRHNFNNHKKGHSHISKTKSQRSLNESCSPDEKIPSDFSISANYSQVQSVNTSDSNANDSSYAMSSVNLTSNSNITSDDNSTSNESDGYKSKKSTRTTIGLLTPSYNSTSDGKQTTSDSDDSNTNDTSSDTTDKTTTGSPSSSFSGVFPSDALKQNDLFLGFLPDDGSSGGNRQTMAQINSALSAKSSGYGWYSQIFAGQTYDGSQLLAVMDDVKACNCVFQPAVMPTQGWSGLTSDDNSQAVAIAKVMKKFTDEGIPVWLRFAHEVNYYQTDGTYKGTSEDFKKGWAAVSAAIKSIAPEVKMWWTPNVATADNYAKYEPYDLSTVDLVGVDFYPKKLTGSDFIDTMKDFHDKYAVDGRMFAIGETGLGYAGSIEDRFKWLSEIAAAKSSMPQFITASWFNFHKEWNYRIAGESNLDSRFSSFLAS